jgi:dTDP-4-amino-4,6-dideoxygalactose transaminase
MQERRVPFLNLRVQDVRERAELISAVEAVFLHGRLVMGPEVEEFEKRIAQQCDRQFAVGVNSGTDALFLALRSLDIGPGDEVITTSLSWIATANAIALTGAKPVFADIREDLNIDPDAVRTLVGPRTRAIMPVHYTGKICHMNALHEIAREAGCYLIEDASQAFGALHRGRKAGSFGDVACFSMNPMKVLAACGEAGVILTDRHDLYERLISLRYNGTVNRETCVEVSLNARLDTLQAAILLKRLGKVEAIIDTRRQNAAWYSAQLAGYVDTPREEEWERDVYYTYTIRSPRRDDLRSALTERGIETKIQHPLLMPEQPAYQACRTSDLSRAKQLVREILCIPGHEKLTADDLQYVAACIREFCGREQS